MNEWFKLPPLPTLGKTQVWRTYAPTNVIIYTCWPEMGYCSGGERGIRCSNPVCADKGQYHDPGDESD